MTRRTIFNLFGLLPAISSLKATAEPTVDRACDCSAKYRWIHEHVREYDPEAGDVGRGQKISVAEAVSIVRCLRHLGFVPFVSPTGPYVTVFSSTLSRFDVAPVITGKELIWVGFVSELNGKHQVVSFEFSREDSLEFDDLTQISRTTDSWSMIDASLELPLNEFMNISPKN